MTDTRDRPRWLILSIFPGLDLLGRAFEELGHCVVRGPDVIWGGDARTFHPPPGTFDGVIGGPPCQDASPLAKLVRSKGYEVSFGNLVPEFNRIVEEAGPRWFLMEQVPQAPLAEVPGYDVHAQRLNNVWLGEEQNRLRMICFGTHDGRRLHVELAPLQRPVLARTVTSSIGGRSKRSPALATSSVDRSQQGRRSRVLVQQGAATVTAAHGGNGAQAEHDRRRHITRYTIPDALRLQGLPDDYLRDAPFTVDGKRRAIANGVPLPMGRALARAVERAMA